MLHEVVCLCSIFLIVDLHHLVLIVTSCILLLYTVHMMVTRLPVVYDDRERRIHVVLLQLLLDDLQIWHKIAKWYVYQLPAVPRL